MGVNKVTEVFSSTAYRKLADESKDRLARGAALRAEMQRQIEAGVVPTGYRAEFLNEVAQDIFRVLCAAAEKFNRHGDDLWSVADQMDALATVRKRLLDGVKEFRRMDNQQPGEADG